MTVEGKRREQGLEFEEGAKILEVDLESHRQRIVVWMEVGVEGVESLKGGVYFLDGSVVWGRWGEDCVELRDIEEWWEIFEVEAKARGGLRKGFGMEALGGDGLWKVFEVVDEWERGG